MSIHDYYAALSIGCKKHNLPSPIINEIFKFELDDIRKKINVDFLEKKLITYQKTVMKRRKKNQLVSINFLERSIHYNIAEEFTFHIYEYPFQIIDIKETACIIEKLVSKHKIELQFSQYCCFPNRDDPATGVRFLNHDRFYRGALTGVESIS